VAEDAEAAPEERLLDAVTGDGLGGEEAEERLARGQPQDTRAAARAAARFRFAGCSYPITSLNASMYACAFPDGPLSVIFSGRSGSL
jgi:hypothetical protein